MTSTSVAPPRENHSRIGKRNAANTFIDGKHIGTIYGCTKPAIPRDMKYTVATRGSDVFSALSLHDAKRRVRESYGDL